MVQATILIVTRNRRETAKNSVASALSQAGHNQVLVIDDGSTDGTADYLRDLFPQVGILSYPDSQGYIVRRNQGCERAEGPIVFSIDDDAEYTDANVVNDTLKVFDEPRAAVAMIPHVNYSPQMQPGWHAPIAPDDGQTYITNSFIGTAYAVRRDVFNSLGGYQTRLFHWGEESEFCQRLLNAGYVPVMGTRHRIKHYPQQPGKYNRKNQLYIYRNRILAIWFNAPLLLLIPLLLAEAGRSTFKAAGTQWISIEGAWMGFREIMRCRSLRKPVRLKAYRLYFKLRKHKILPLSVIRAQLPAICALPERTTQPQIQVGMPA